MDDDLSPSPSHLRTDSLRQIYTMTNEPSDTRSRNFEPKFCQCRNLKPCTFPLTVRRLTTCTLSCPSPTANKCYSLLKPKFSRSDKVSVIFLSLSGASNNEEVTYSPRYLLSKTFNRPFQQKRGFVESNSQLFHWTKRPVRRFKGEDKKTLIDWSERRVKASSAFVRIQFQHRQSVLTGGSQSLSTNPQNSYTVPQTFFRGLGVSENFQSGLRGS